MSEFFSIDEPEYLLKEAEELFLNFEYDDAFSKWRLYLNEGEDEELLKFVNEIIFSWEEESFLDIHDLSGLFEIWSRQRGRYRSERISKLTFALLERLLTKIYQKRFQEHAKKEYTITSGIFEYLSNDPDSAIPRLTRAVTDNSEDTLAKSYLGLAYYAKNDHRSAMIYLSQNLFLDAGNLAADDFFEPQIKLIYQDLFSIRKNKKISAWLTVFESWFKDLLIFRDEPHFFILMQQKERNERILQVKYYPHERYRHFIRCLFVAEYGRLFRRKETDLVLEQEHYMEKLDRQLFARYRQKRKS
ncbi:MAG: hypothetical protein AB7T22_00880 [Calditrichaceae bacterium]